MNILGSRTKEWDKSNEPGEDRPLVIDEVVKFEKILG